MFDFTDRRSAYDKVVGKIKGIGRIQSEASALVYNTFEDHGIPTAYIAQEGKYTLQIEMDRYPVEIVGRRAITGTFATRLRDDKSVKVMRLNVEDRTHSWVTWTLGVDGKFISPEGKAYAENEMLDQPIIEFSTKLEADSKTGHDEYMDAYDRILGVSKMNEQELYHAYSIALKVEEICRDITEKTGVRFKDFKIEVGKPKGYTPGEGEDPNAYMYLVDSFAPDEFRTEPDFGKQPFRDWLSSKGWNGPEDGPSPRIAQDAADQQVEAYSEFLRLMRNLVHAPGIRRDALSGTHVLIFSGSESDRNHVRNIQKELTKYGIYSIDRVMDALNGWTDEKFDANMPVYEWRVCSAHRNREIDEFIAGYNDLDRVYISVAGMSDALSGVLASRGGGHPVIACPPEPEKYKQIDAYGVSSLDMPPLVPVAFIARPDNAALFAAQIIGKQYQAVRLLANEAIARKAASNLSADIKTSSKY